MKLCGETDLSAPNIQWFVADGVENGEESTLIRIPKHFQPIPTISSIKISIEN
jgi:hypothetical protein